MDPLSLAEYLQAVASAIAAGRLIQFGFSRKQPALLGFLIFISIDLTALASIDPSSRTYFRIYLAGTFLNWLTGIFAVREMMALTFDRYAGIRSFGRWMLYAAIGVSTAATILITSIFGRKIGRGSPLLYYTHLVDGAVVLTLAVVIAALLIALSLFPLHLSHNTYVSTGFFSAVFLSEAVVLVMDNLSNALYLNLVDVAQVAFAAVCLLGWALALRPEPAVAESRRIVFDNPAENDMLRQLESVNRFLTRVGRQ